MMDFWSGVFFIINFVQNAEWFNIRALAYRMGIILAGVFILQQQALLMILEKICLFLLLFWEIYFDFGIGSWNPNVLIQKSGDYSWIRNFIFFSSLNNL